MPDVDRTARWRLLNPERAKEITRNSTTRQRAAAKIKVLNYYGAKCNCCGESAIEFLTVEHINGDGRQRRNRGNAWMITVREGFPDDIQILCFNCNCSRGFFGYCPHNPNEKEIAS